MVPQLRTQLREPYEGGGVVGHPVVGPRGVLQLRHHARGTVIVLEIESTFISKFLPHVIHSQCLNDRDYTKKLVLLTPTCARLHPELV